MNKHKLISVFDGIKPDSELVKHTKKKMRLAVSGRKGFWWSTVLRIAPAACLTLVLVAALYSLKKPPQPEVFKGYFTAKELFYQQNVEDDNILLAEDNLIPPDLKSEESMQKFKEQFQDFARAECGTDSRLLILEGKVITSNSYLVKDGEQLDILGLTMLQVKVNKIKYKDDIEEGHVGGFITVASYINSYEHLHEFKEGGQYLFYLYTGKNYDPTDAVGSIIGLRQTWLKYAAFLPES